MNINRLKGDHSTLFALTLSGVSMNLSKILKYYDIQGIIFRIKTFMTDTQKHSHTIETENSLQNVS